MTVQEILDSSKTKTWKIQQLILLGQTRSQIAILVTNGNYGFVQNVYATMQRQRASAAASQSPPQAVAQIVPVVTASPSTTRNPRSTPTLASPGISQNNLISMEGNRILNPLTEKFGIEIEAFNVPKADLCASIKNAGVNCEIEAYNHRTRPAWKIVTDGSIRGTEAFEVVSPILVGDAGLLQLKKVCITLQIKNAKVNNTCGLHVHFDATEITPEILKNILINYMNFEAEIDKFLPESRRGNTNTYSQSITRHRTAVENARTMAELIRVFPDRYYKLNLKSYSRHNTIEFRQHSGTVEYEKIANWVIFLHNLIDYSKQHRYPRATANFEALKRLNEKVVYDFLITRINQLAA